MFNWLLKLIPAGWTWNVAAKKVAYMVGKAVAAILAYKKLALISEYLTPDQSAQIQMAAGAIAAAALEALHDYLKMKFPDANWL